LTVVDAYTREALAIEADRGIRGEQVVEALTRLGKARAETRARKLFYRTPAAYVFTTKRRKPCSTNSAMPVPLTPRLDLSVEEAGFEPSVPRKRDNVLGTALLALSPPR
jgi:hypothetical protein